MSSLKANGELTERVLTFIRLYPSPEKRATKRMIAAYLGLPYSNSHNNLVDRKIRNAVTELRKMGEPVCSDSGRAGYWYSYADLDIIIADLKSRGREMFDTASVLERARRQHETRNVRQLELV